MKKNIIYLLIFTFLFLLFKYNNIVLTSTIDATNIWFNKVFPYLFIMIIVNDLLINLNFIKLFKTPSIYVFIMSLLSGTPSSAFIVGNLYQNKSITKNDANNILLFTYFSNPLFLYTILNNIFNNNYITIKIIIIHYLSNLIIFLFIIKKLDNKLSNLNNNTLNLSSSIKKAINTNLIVLGTICFYLVISNILCEILNINSYFIILLKGLLEMTQGLNSLIKTNIYYKELLATVFISFGGLSIHTQVKSLLDDYELNYNYFLKGRLIGLLISIILIAL